MGKTSHLERYLTKNATQPQQVIPPKIPISQYKPGLFSGLADDELGTNLGYAGGTHTAAHHLPAAAAWSAQHLHNFPFLNQAVNYAAHHLPAKLKSIPGIKELGKDVGPTIGAMSGMNRYNKGDYVGAALDGVSTLGMRAGDLPTSNKTTARLAKIGPLVSTGADIINFGRDYRAAKLTFPTVIGTENPINTTGLAQSGSREMAAGDPTPKFEAQRFPTKVYPASPDTLPPSVMPGTPVQAGSHKIPAQTPIKQGEDYAEAFKRGMFKKAKELGLHKEAFVGPLIAGALRFGAPMLGSMGLEAALARGAMMSGRKGMMGAVGKGAQKINKLMQAPGLKGMMANQAMYQLASAGTDKLIDPIASRLENNRQHQ